LDLLEYSKDPIVVSHSSSSAHGGTLRPVSDDKLRLIGKNGGLVGIFALNLRSSMPTIDSYVDHLVHVSKVAGIDSVSLGFDFCDYIPETLSGMDPSFKVDDIPGLKNHSNAQNVISRLSDRGFSSPDIRKIAHENVLRLFKDVL
jgi:membrane dipeptidase